MRIPLGICTLLIVLGTSGYSQDTVRVEAGWNIIGAVKAGAVPDVLVTIPDSLIVTSFFGYAPGVGYQSTDTLGKGVGYWVKAASNGVIVFDTAPPSDSCKSRAFIYQGKLYNTVRIGDRCWMAENLDAGAMVTGVIEQTDNATLEKYCHGDDPLNCALYGGLYQWDEAMQYGTAPGAQGICPGGWHLPTLAELQSLSPAAGGDGNALKAIGQGAGAGAGTNTTGFSALFAGNRSNVDGSFASLGEYGIFWSSTQTNAADANLLYLSSATSTIYQIFHDKGDGFSVRCIGD